MGIQHIFGQIVKQHVFEDLGSSVFAIAQDLNTQNVFILALYCKKPSI